MATTAERMALVEALELREPATIDALVEYVQAQIVNSELVAMQIEEINAEMKTLALNTTQ